MLCRGSSPFLPSPTARRQSNLSDTLLHLKGVLCLLVAWAAVISISRVEIPLVCGTWVERGTWGQLAMLLSPRHEPCFCWLGAKDTSYATVVHAHIISIPHVDWPQLKLTLLALFDNCGHWTQLAAIATRPPRLRAIAAMVSHQADCF
jgi:hypothetical protein